MITLRAALVALLLSTTLGGVQAATAPPPDIVPPAGSTGDPFALISIDALAARDYGGTGIVLGRTLSMDPRGFTQYEMHYESDGLTITGLINIPAGDGPFPVVICNHGYIDPAIYEAGDDTWRMAAWFAEHNYIAVMPDYRNYGGSDVGPNPFRVGYAVDVMNLIGQLGSLPTADPQRVGVIGHSLGGEISLWPAVINEEIDAVVLYAAMSGDIARNWDHRWRHFPVQRDAMRATAGYYGPPEDNPAGYAAASPISHLERIQAPVSIHHGLLDTTVPAWWSQDLAERLTLHNHSVELTTYPGQGHGFTTEAYDLLLERALAFFDAHVR